MKCNLTYYTWENIHEMNHILISFFITGRVVSYIDSCGVATHELFEDRFQHLRYAALREVPELIPCVRCDTPGRERIKGYSELRERKQDERQKRPTSIVVRDFPVTFGRQFNCRGTFGLFVEFPVSCSSEAFNDILYGPSELHETYSSIYARGYNILLKKWESVIKFIFQIEFHVWENLRTFVKPFVDRCNAEFQCKWQKSCLSPSFTESK